MRELNSLGILESYILLKEKNPKKVFFCEDMS